MEQELGVAADELRPAGEIGVEALHSAVVERKDGWIPTKVRKATWQSQNPAKQKTTGDDRAAKNFIDGAGKAPASDGKTPVLFRFKNEFLARIDAAAKKAELPRLAWVRTVIARELENEGF
jgi:hypothetical protein